MKVILLAIGRFAQFLEHLTRRPEVLQLHLIAQDGESFQIAQKTFPHGTGPGPKLAWFSEMTSKSIIVNQRPQIYSPGEKGFIAIDRTDFGPTFLTTNEALK